MWGVGLTREGSWEMGLDKQEAYEVFNREVGLGQTSLQNQLEGVGQPPQEARTPHPPYLGNVQDFGNSMTSYSGRGNSLEPVHPHPCQEEWVFIFPFLPLATVLHLG